MRGLTSQGPLYRHKCHSLSYDTYNEDDGGGLESCRLSGCSPKKVLINSEFMSVTKTKRN